MNQQIQEKEKIEIQAMTEKDGIFYMAIKTSALKEDLEVVTQKYIKSLLAIALKEQKSELYQKIQSLNTDEMMAEEVKEEVLKIIKKQNE